ncbi:NADPH:quinone reductase [Chitinophaga terrae (ex Kim and Jung 2007)]|uniref:NADPH:quinone reductase n=1 Tax=Chitinophaga terrae (ex Kim and Jung 2007) TaxID=408074 RepID=A0A1H4GF00_9BACT|nr:NAD(P)-dependent alcohol dehydrogenase [Chitinophaga terrae (ex Kim and Jung 2007)]GEP93340.1 oxidoreductase [Chitinophaga terrae (ex Kim and Jung 2007)]SEB07468.1 NADPH:quinone reductase [Chitinophaga terrae (ex Kim and Jung 2007)]
MKAIAYQKFGNTDVLQTVEETKPAIRSNEVLVKVKAVSINPMDWKIRKGEMKLMSGSRFPRHTGVDFAGVIEDTGVAVTNFKKGDEVFGVVKNTMKDGALADYVAVPGTLIWKKPTAITFAEAAAIPIAGAAATTALQKMGKINPGTSILINGATGGFGMFLLQLLKDRKAVVTAVTGTKGIDYAKQWGADIVLDYTKADVLTQNATYDIVIDLSGKMGYSKAKRIMNRKALFLNPTPKPVQIPASFLNNLFTNKKHVVILSAASTPHINLLTSAIGNGLQVEVSRRFPFDKVVEAYQYAEKGGVTGKVVIELD